MNKEQLSTEISVDTILKSKRLPSLPTVAVELLEMANNEEVSLAEFSSVVKKDPALVVRVLKAANSPIVGASAEILAIDQAVSLLGQSRTITQALGFYLTDDVIAWSMKDQYEQFWLRSAINGAACRVVAEKAKLDASEIDYFLVGLLLDIGQLAMLNCIKEGYWQVYELASVEQIDLHLLEKQTFGFDHAQVGGDLLGQWKLPPKLCELVSRHNDEAPRDVDVAVCKMAGLCRLFHYRASSGAAETHSRDWRDND